MKLPYPYLLFLGDIDAPNRAKTALGLAHWAPEKCLAQIRMNGCAGDTGLKDMSCAEAAANGAKAMVIGVAPQGGSIPVSWHPALLEALDAGLDLISGMHDRLSDIPGIVKAAARQKRHLFDVRHSQLAIPSANGKKRTGLRCLMIGLDSALGKKWTALAITRELKDREIKATFRATGQTGIMIAGEGIAVDAVPADFIAGAAEILSPDNEDDHWDIIEGQGSIYHAAYAGVSLGLLHGSQPDAMVLCGHATREHLELLPHIPHRTYEEAIRTHEHLARVTNPSARVVGISINTSDLGQDAEAREFLQRVETRTGLPTVDPIRFGCTPVAEALQEMMREAV
ncbi:MAG: DUF1611 domain-containing protein [Pseudomonadota bacterium]